MNATPRWTRWLLASGLCAGLIACGGGSGEAVQPTPTAALRLDSAAAVTRTVGPAGGTLAATATDGSVHTLTVPPKALRRDTAITLTPIASIADLPAGVSLAGGTHLTPEGLKFDSPVTLEVELAAAPASAPVPFSYSGELQQRHLYPATLAGRTIRFEIVHFSGYAALIGQLEALLGPSDGYFPLPGPAGDQALQALVTAALQAPSATRNTAMLGALRGWLDGTIKPAVVAVQAFGSVDLDTDPVVSPSFDAALRLAGDMQIFAIAMKYAVLMGASEWEAIDQDFKVAVRDAALHLIPRLNAACSQFPDAWVLAVPEVLEWQALAQGSGAAALEPALDRAAVLQALCIQAAYDPNGGVDFPTGLQPGQSGMLTVRAGYTVNGGPVRFDQPLFVLLNGASNVSPAGLQAPLAPAAGASVQQTFLWEPATTEMRVDVEICLADPLLREVCQSAFVVRGQPSEPPPPPPVGTCPSYSATAAGTTRTGSDFLVGAFAEARTFDSEATALSREDNLLTVDVKHSSAAATGTVFYTVDERLESGAPISFVVLWSGHAEVEAGSVMAMLTVNGNSTSDTASTTRPMLLQLPVTARHGDTLQITVSVAGSSGVPGEQARVFGTIGGVDSVFGLDLNPVTCR
jgi:hypothetical protein